MASKWVEVSESELEAYKGVSEDIKEYKGVMDLLEEAEKRIKVCIPQGEVREDCLNRLNDVLANIIRICWLSEKEQKANEQACAEQGHVGKWVECDRQVSVGFTHITKTWRERTCVRCGFKESTEEEIIFK